MAQFKVGDKVIREDSGKKGIVIEVPVARRGRQLYVVNWGDFSNEALETELIADSSVTYDVVRIYNDLRNIITK